MAEEYHYPPELFELLEQTIPLLVRGKQDVLTFFKSISKKDRSNYGRSFKF